MGDSQQQAGEIVGYVRRTGAPPDAVIEVDGALDVARAHDLRRAVMAAVRQGALDMDLDLSRVSTVADEAERAVAWCIDHAAAAGATVRVSALSRPAARSPQLAALVSDENPPHASP